ncbi:MAG TPA: class I SAM-dependent methyltransferase [Gemmatimonadaceae bacterium]|jgi:ubiquinone/menaquinone biosynthesis C-methylase UbiE
MNSNDTTAAAAAPKSAVLHSMAAYYDVLAALVTLGREREFRERLATLAGIAAGDAVVDTGCGTGSLAIAAKRKAGNDGMVAGIDASVEMIERARRKVAKARLIIQFETSRVEALPFKDDSVDVVLSTLMMHHLPPALRERCAAEIVRVLRRGGRVLVADFEKPTSKRGGLLSRCHRHRGVPMRDIVALLGSQGLDVIEIGSVGVSDVQFAVATKPRGDHQLSRPTLPIERSLPPLPVPRWLAKWMPLAAIAVAVVVHLFVARWLWGVVAVGTLASAAAVAAIIGHVAFAGGAGVIARRHRRR